MTHPDQSDLMLLTEPRDGPCISLFLPTVPHSAALQEDQARLRILLRQAEAQLGERDAERILAPLRKLADDEAFRDFPGRCRPGAVANAIGKGHLPDTGYALVGRYPNENRMPGNDDFLLHLHINDFDGNDLHLWRIPLLRYILRLIRRGLLSPRKNKSGLERYIIA